MKSEDRELTSSDMFLSLHGTLLALITSLHRAGNLPETEFFEQMTHSEITMIEEREPFAAQLIRSYAESLSAEWEREQSSG